MALPYVFTMKTRAMAKREKSGPVFMDLPPEIRSMIYKLVIQRDPPHGCIALKNKSENNTYYRIGCYSPIFPAKKEAKIDLLLVNRQIYFEARAILYSTQLYLQLSDDNFDHFDEVRKSRFLPRQFESLHSVFGHLRDICIELSYFPWDITPPHPNNSWIWSDIGDSFNADLRSLYPSLSRNSCTAVRSLKLEYTSRFWEVGVGDVEYIFDLLGGFINLVPADVNCSLSYWFYPNCDLKIEKWDSDTEEHYKFGKWLQEEFAARRAEHVARIGQSEKQAGRVQEVEDDAAE